MPICSDPNLSRLFCKVQQSFGAGTLRQSDRKLRTSQSGKSLADVHVEFPSAIGKMILNVNRSSAPLVKPGNLVDILMEFMNARDVNRVNPLNPQMPKDVRLKILRFLKGMYVKIKTRNPRDKL